MRYFICGYIALNEEDSLGFHYGNVGLPLEDNSFPNSEFVKIQITNNCKYPKSISKLQIISVSELSEKDYNQFYGL